MLPRGPLKLGVRSAADEVTALLQPGSIIRNKAWHEDIKGFANFRNPAQVTKARESFAKQFGAHPEGVPECAVRRMVGLKRIRNDFAHDGQRLASCAASRQLAARR
jgi:hypothetical protein